MEKAGPVKLAADVEAPLVTVLYMASLVGLYKY